MTLELLNPKKVFVFVEKIGYLARRAMFLLTKYVMALLRDKDARWIFLSGSYFDRLSMNRAHKEK